MKSVRGAEFVRELKRKGWALDHVSGSHHIMMHPDFPLPVTVPVHAGRDLSRGLVCTLLKQTGLKETDF